MTQKGNFKLKKVLKNRGLYCSVNFEIKLDETKKSNLIIDYKADSQWEAASNLGIMIFYDYFSRQYNVEMTVTIDSIDWMPVDTNNAIILYSVIKGLSEVLKYPIDGLKIDDEKESFVLPELRSIQINL